MAANDFASVSDMNMRMLILATNAKIDAITWSREHGLLKRSRSCPVCGKDMRQEVQVHKGDGYRFICCKTEVSIREGSFFSGSKLKLWQIILVLYMYSYEFANVKILRRECEIAGPQAITKWRNYVRNIYSEYFLRHSAQVGGPGHTVEIDECSFWRRKPTMGKDEIRQLLFGGIDVDTKDVFLVAVETRNPETLHPVLQQYVLPGTTVVSDLGYDHMTVNELKFVNPIALETPNHESMWCRAKHLNKKECGTSHTHLGSYLIEYMWREKFGNDPFQNLLEHLREVYPC